MEKIIYREKNEEDFILLQTGCRDELMSVDDEIKLIRQIQQGVGDLKTAVERLKRANLRFVRAVARRYVSDRFLLEELIEAGNIGLERAICKFDETRGFKFISYAEWWIRKSIEQHIEAERKE